MDAHDIQRHNEGRIALAREQLGRIDRLGASLARQAAALVITAGALLIADVLLALPAVQGQLGIEAPLGVAVSICLGAAAACALAAALGAMSALVRGHGRGPTTGAGGARPALFFDLLGSADIFASPAEYGAAFRSALDEEMIDRVLAELWRAGRVARVQRTALRWALGCLLAGFGLLVAALLLALAGT